MFDIFYSFPKVQKPTVCFKMSFKYIYQSIQERGCNISLKLHIDNCVRLGTLMIVRGHNRSMAHCKSHKPNLCLKKLHLFIADVFGSTEKITFL